MGIIFFGLISYTIRFVTLSEQQAIYDVRNFKSVYKTLFLTAFLPLQCHRLRHTIRLPTEHVIWKRIRNRIFPCYFVSILKDYQREILLVGSAKILSEISTFITTNTVL
jgi:hypothetical protein